MGTVCLLVELRYSLRMDQKQHSAILDNFYLAIFYHYLFVYCYRYLFLFIQCTVY